MKKTTCSLAVVFLAIIILVAAAFGADPAPVAAAITPSAEPSLFAWFVVNKAAVFGVVLAISEFLALIPAFKGNGILDTIIKALQSLSGKEAGTQ